MCVPGDGVESIVASVLGLPESQVGDDTGPATEGGWTSLSHLQIIDLVQRRYGVTFTSREIRSARSVRAVRQLLAERGEPA